MKRLTLAFLFILVASSVFGQATPWWQPNDAINSRSFGFANDGSDETAKFNLMLRAAETQNLPIQLNGVDSIIMSDSLHIRVPIWGNGVLLHISDSGYFGQGIVMETNGWLYNLEIDYDSVEVGAAHGGYGQPGVNASGAGNHGGYGATVVFGDYSTGASVTSAGIVGCTIHGTERVGGNCLVITGGSNGITIRDNKFVSLGLTETASLVHWGKPAKPTYHPNNIVFEGNTFDTLTYASGRAFNVSGSFNVIIRNNVVRGAAYGVSVFCGDYGFRYQDTTVYGPKELQGQGIIVENLVVNNCRERYVWVTGRSPYLANWCGADSIADSAFGDSAGAPTYMTHEDAIFDMPIKIIGGSSNGSATSDAGIAMTYTDGMIVDHVDISGHSTGLATFSTVRNLTVQDSKFHGNRGRGILLGYSDIDSLACRGAAVSNNKVFANWANVNDTPYAEVLIANCLAPTVIGNIIGDTAYDCAAWYGLQVTNTCDEGLFFGNVVNGVYDTCAGTDTAAAYKLSSSADLYSRGWLNNDKGAAVEHMFKGTPVVSSVVGEIGFKDDGDDVVLNTITDHVLLGTVLDYGKLTLYQNIGTAPTASSLANPDSAWLSVVNPSTEAVVSSAVVGLLRATGTARAAIEFRSDSTDESVINLWLENNGSLGPRYFFGSDGKLCLGANNADSQAVTKKYVDGLSGTGEVNTASNAGAGFKLVEPKAGSDLPFKTLTGGDGIALDTGTANQLNIAHEAHTGDVTGATGLTIANGAVDTVHFNQTETDEYVRLLIGPFIDTTTLDTIQNAHKAVLSDSTGKLDTTYTGLTTYVANHAGAGAGDLLADGSVPMTADWPTGDYDITGIERLEADTVAATVALNTPEVNVTGAESGTIVLSGATSGQLSLTVADAAGTPTEWVFPTDNGTNGYQLTTNGSGTLSWGAAGSGGADWSDSVDNSLVPKTDDAYDIGVATREFRNGYFDGTLEADALTEGGNAVYNSSEIPGGELGGTWASPTIDDDALDDQYYDAEEDVEAVVDLQDCQGAVTDGQVPNDITITQASDVDSTGTEIAAALADRASIGGAYHDGFSDFVANEHIDWTADQGATNIHAGNYTDTDTHLSQENVQDSVGAMLGGTETRISVTYDDAGDAINFVVDDMNDDEPDAGDLGIIDTESEFEAELFAVVVPGEVPGLETDAGHDTFAELGGTVSDAQVPDDITITEADDVEPTGTKIAAALAAIESGIWTEVADIAYYEDMSDHDTLQEVSDDDGGNVTWDIGSDQSGLRIGINADSVRIGPAGLTEVDSLDVLGVFYLDGTKVTATATEINRLDGDWYESHEFTRVHGYASNGDSVYLHTPHVVGFDARALRCSTDVDDCDDIRMVMSFVAPYDFLADTLAIAYEVSAASGVDVDSVALVVNGTVEVNSVTDFVDTDAGDTLRFNLSGESISRGDRVAVYLQFDIDTDGAWLDISWATCEGRRQW